MVTIGRGRYAGEVNEIDGDFHRLNYCACIVQSTAKLQSKMR